MQPRGTEEALRIMYLGRLGEAKGADTLLEALARLPARRWTAALAGDGDIAKYRRLAARLDLADATAFPGWLDEQATRELLIDSHVHVLPSKAEGLPMALLEAMAAGVATVATPVGAVPEVIQHRETGLLVPVGDVDALTASIAELLDDDALRLRLAVAARSAWEGKYNIDAYADALTTIWLAAAQEG